jgi:predicted GNAT family acetyltransferase
MSGNHFHPHPPFDQKKWCAPFTWTDRSIWKTTVHGRKGITINYVFTPPSERGQGLAANAVACLSERQLNAGYSFCSLYTDAQFPTSNALYQRLGYYRVCESAMYSFT